MVAASATVVGAGPTGAFAALLLAKRGYSVDVFERRHRIRDMHKTENMARAESFASMEKKDVSSATASLARVADASKRSINLALSHRGLRALACAGLSERAIEMAVPMRGRMIHDKKGNMALQPYGTKEEEVLYSISRTAINAWLLDELEKCDKARVHYGYSCTRVWSDGTAEFTRQDDGGFLKPDKIKTESTKLLGCDGAFSAVRAQLARISRLSINFEYIEHGYKELSMPPAADGGYAMPPEALHIWPGSQVMLIALPNADCSFTCTLFGDFKLLESLQTPQQVLEFFGDLWPDTIGLMPNLVADYFDNPNAALSTVRCAPWNIGGHILLLGDAAHGVVPFYGQGMNCALEDCLLLNEALDSANDEWETALPAFYASRKPATDCLAQLAIDNYEEMRDKTVSRVFLLKNKIHGLLHTAFGDKWQPSLHTAVSFTSMPYHHALAVWQKQDSILSCVGYAAAAAAALAATRAVQKMFHA